MIDAVRVLYVDQGGLGQAMVRTLENERIHPVRARDGVDALKRLDLEPIDVVVVPDRLPGFELRRFVERARALEPDVSIVVRGAPDDLPAGAFHVPTDASGRKLRDRLEEIIADRTLGSALEGQDHLEGVAFEIAYEVVTAEDEGSILDAFYDAVAGSDLFRFVWVGRYVRPSGELHGERPFSGRFTPNEVTETLDVGDPDFVAEAVESAEVTVAESGDRTRSTASVQPAPGAEREPSRPTVVYAAVPFPAGGRTRGIALLGANRADAFDVTERSLLAKLGAVVGNGLAAAGRRGPPGRSNPARIKQFVDVLAHELRNPMQIADAYLELGRKTGDDEALERVRTAHESIAEIIDAVVRMAGSGGIDEVVEVDVADVAADVWQRVRRGSAELTVSTSVTVDADPELLKRLLSNLFTNAIDHAGPDASVRVGTLADGSGFFVEDDGPGIPESDRETVLEWGYSTGDDHLGIGLGIVREITEAHGWEVSIAEGRNGGTRVEIETHAPETSTDGGLPSRTGQ